MYLVESMAYAGVSSNESMYELKEPVRVAREPMKDERPNGREPSSFLPFLTASFILSERSWFELPLAEDLNDSTASEAAVKSDSAVISLLAA